MPNPVSTCGDRSQELIGERIDIEDAIQLVELAMQVPGRRRETVIALMRQHAGRMDPEAFALLKAELADEGGELPDRVLLKAGDRGENVCRLRSALGSAAELLGDARIAPGAGSSFDRRCETALMAFQHRMGHKPTGELDSRSLRLINYALTQSDAPLLDVDAEPPKVDWNVYLHFYPGDQQRKLVVRREGKVLDVYDMRGGPSRYRRDRRSRRYGFLPTPRGRYHIKGSAAHTSQSWYYSQVPFGAKLRMKDGQVQFRQQGEWKFATGAASVLARPMEVKDFLADGGGLPEHYTRNDFGHRAFYLIERSGRTAGHMIHPTPRGEERYGDDSFELLESHGCEHMRPADLDEARAKGYLQRGRSFEVHGYDEPLPEDVKAFLRLRSAPERPD
ncbi:MAG: hypothetical protein JXR96_21510 [Deltaproteobacteria bacterium]|nr:hypothetical protein [Deltaproteobacteria bacterium]